MGCSPIQVHNKNEIFNLKRASQNISTVKDLKITEGMWVQETKGDPFEFYEEWEIWGEGSFGKVFKVQHKISKVQRALKQIQKDKADLSDEDEKAMINEINVIKSLDHPNIMKVYEYYNTDTCFYIISELCTGGEWFDKIQEQNHLSEKVSKDYSPGLKAGKYMNRKQRGCEKEYFTIKVIDFGTSDRLAKGNMCKVQIGTPFYIAPEVLSNQYNEKCDLWSCGVIWYIMLCGVPPFYGETDEEIYANVKRGVIDYAEEEWASVTEDAKDWINKLLVKNIKVRMAAKDALVHKWFNNLNQEVNARVDKQVLELIIYNMKMYSATQKLQQATLAFIVHNLIRKEDTEKLRECFIQFDIDGDGHLDKSELTSGLNLVMPLEEAEKEVNRIMEIIDVDGNGFIEFEEFLRAALDKKKILTTENVKTVFRWFDKHDTGQITAEEWKQVMGNEDEIDDKVWKEMVDEIDWNADGKISFYEFDKMMDLVREDCCNTEMETVKLKIK